MHIIAMLLAILPVLLSAMVLPAVDCSGAATTRVLSVRQEGNLETEGRAWHGPRTAANCS